MKDDNQFELPYQIQSLIGSLRDRKEQVHVRSNYRSRLDAISRAINTAIVEYDNEMGVASVPKFRKGRR